MIWLAQRLRPLILVGFCVWCEDGDSMAVLLPMNGKKMKAVPSVNPNVRGELYKVGIWAAN